MSAGIELLEEFFSDKTQMFCRSYVVEISEKVNLFLIRNLSVFENGYAFPEIGKMPGVIEAQPSGQDAL
jgi:hypothetical protein